MKVLVYEQWHGGHYDNYLATVVPAAAHLAESVVVAVNGAMRTSEIGRRLDALPNVSFAEELPPVDPTLSFSARLAAARNLHRTLETVRPDFAMLPSADAQALGMATLPDLRRAVTRAPVEATFHFGYGNAAETPREKFKEWVYSAVMRRLPVAGVNFVNVAYHDYVLSKGLVPAHRCRMVGDPVPQPRHIGARAARSMLGIDPEGRYIGLLGMLDHRKAVPQIADAFATAKLRPDDRLLLAGKLAPEHRVSIERLHAKLIRSGRIVLLDRHLSNRELESGYEALDVATVAYRRSPGLASLALKAMAAGTPIVGDDFGWMGYLLRRFEIGTAVDVHQTEAFARAIERTLVSERPSRSPSVEALLAFHHPDNFAGLMTMNLARAAGVSPMPTIGWSAVLESVHRR